ncbi:hypothetical protein Kisp01_14680 [Kineosporia sp. NBRC 101677]|uniref:NACHT domain-containing protein n=1 Tax=Kineosporia sp. NBRC 101677 TaxID=3032197 RepID=UPI0024A37C92|nr:hypothetical protein [Kineosporia sp. NBRC 101677]GLY14453.1 hypothetical protein Kisp01_14680 [Kineosporia sp. NBRC 101677]
MSDYDFSRLSTRSFESLVQALAVAVVGPMVQVFGDGRDGGREAIFQGATLYPTPDACWDGYGVIQAKFRQREDQPGSESNTKWALGHLESELREYEKDDSLRTLPDYYIFATNVPLTPYPTAGGKDSLSARLEKFSKEHGLKGWALWDYDQIGTFLDDHAAIRQTYSAWTTPGDVLARLISSMAIEEADLASILATYLAKELARDQNALLQQGGHAPEEEISLAKIFIDVPIKMLSSARDAHPFAVEDDDIWFVESFIELAETPITYDAEGGKSKQGRVVLIGGPGQGKTTVGQYASQLFRLALLAKMPPQVLTPQTLDIARDLESGAEQRNLDLPTSGRFPMRVVLSEFADDLANNPDLSLLEHVTSIINKRASRAMSPESLDRFLDAYPFVLILDGLDEVPASGNRTRLLTAINDFEIDVRMRELDALILVTTRPQGYNEELSPKYYQHWQLTPLDPNTALQYGAMLAEQKFKHNPDRAERINRRLTRAVRTDATVRLMASPLQVTIMVLLVDQQGEPPEDRWDLFDRYYQLIYNREIERDIEASELLREHKAEIDRVHHLAGLLLQVQAEVIGGANARLTTETFSNIVAEHLRIEEYAPERIDDLTRRIVDASAQRLVFLVGVEDDRVGFEIRSLQEFMAAEALTEDGDELIPERLRTIAGSPHWRNVFLFAVGKCFRLRRSLRADIVHICHELNDFSASKPHALVRAGSTLALALLQDGGPRRAPTYARQLLRLAFDLFGKEPTSPTQLASLVTVDTVETAQQLVTEGISSRSSGDASWEFLASLIERGTVQYSAWEAEARNHAPLVFSPSLWWRCAAIAQTNVDLCAFLLRMLPQLNPFEVILRGRRIVNSLDHGRESFPLIQTDDPLVTVIRTLSRRTRSRASVSCKEIPNTHFDIVEIGKFGASLSADFMPENLRSSAHPGWAYLAAVLRFSLTPSMESFKQACSFDGRFSTTLDLQAILPWILGHFNWIKKELPHLTDVFSDVSESVVESWLSAEQEWRSVGFSFVASVNQAAGDPREFALCSTGSMPLSQARAQMFLHPQRGEVSGFSGALISENFDDLVSKIKGMEISEMRANSLNLLNMWLLYMHASDAPDVVAHGYRSLFPPDEPFPVDGSWALGSIEIEKNECLPPEERLTYISKMLRLYAFGDRLKVRFPDARERLLNEQNDVGALVQIAFEAAFERDARPFDADMYCRNVKEADRYLRDCARIIIDSRFLGIDVSKTVSLLQSWESDERFINPLSGILSAARMRTEGLTEVSELLVELVSCRENLSPQIRSSARSHLTQLVEEEKTLLGKKERWQDLGLPGGLLDA